ncbi:MAG: hypothetical protein ABL962_11890, partial [Fimbriimonadaceae bacterium]
MAELEWLSMTLQADHLRFLSNNHSRPVAATINTATTDHGVDEVGSSLGVAGFASGALFGDGGCCAIAGGFKDKSSRPGGIDFVSSELVGSAFDSEGGKIAAVTRAASQGSSASFARDCFTRSTAFGEFIS